MFYSGGKCDADGAAVVGSVNRVLGDNVELFECVGVFWVGDVSNVVEDFEVVDGFSVGLVWLEGGGLWEGGRWGKGRNGAVRRDWRLASWVGRLKV